MENISPLVAFSAGLISLLSPCILPMLPVYLGSLCGAGLPRSGLPGRRMAVFFHSLSFVLGFSLVFISLGAGAGLIGQAVSSHLLLVRRISGSLMILFGLFMLAAPRVSWLNYEKRLSGPGNLAGGYLRSFVLGVLFALAWTPCVGPVLAGILTLAFSSESAWRGSLLLSFYSLGLALPFLAAGLLFDTLLPRLKRFNRYSSCVYILGGLLLIAVGSLILLNRLNWFSY
jgi:cytochrome c-type biogenesis protein